MKNNSINIDQLEKYAKPGKNMVIELTNEVEHILDDGHKPFDCVGTYKEVAQALAMSIRKTALPLPYILSKIPKSF